MPTIPTIVAPTEEAVAYCLLDASGFVLVEDQCARRFYAASTIKLHVLAAALSAIEEGCLDSRAFVPAADTFTGIDGKDFSLAGDHRDPTHPTPGTPISISALLTRMIDRSSNEATNHLIEMLGTMWVNTVIQRMGLADTQVGRMIGDPAAVAAGLTNETTPADLAITMRALAGRPQRGGVPVGVNWNEESRAITRAALQTQQDRVIALALPPRVAVGSKSGSVDGIRHDVAFIGDPDGPDVRHLAVMTQGHSEQTANALIVDLVRRLLPDLPV